MKKLTVMALVLAVVVGSSFATPLIGRNGNIGKPFQAFAWANVGYNKTAMSYIWDDGKYETPASYVGTTTASCDVTIGLGLPFGLELDAVAPLAMKQAGDSKSAGLGDVMVYARYGLLQTSLLPVKASLILGANLPTADENASPVLGDRTTDIGIGASVVTSKYFGFVGHARAGYWLNGKYDVPEDAEVKVGNMFEYMVVLDYSASKTLTPELAVSGYSRANNVFDGTPLDNSEVSQHTVNVLLMWKPISMLTIRPKVAFPLTFMSKGGSMANVYGGLDVWVTFP
jgi:hypothetical protein